MNISDLKQKFEDIDIAYSKAVKDHLADFNGDSETKDALNEIAAAVLDALGDTQDAIIEYLKKQ